MSILKGKTVDLQLIEKEDYAQSFEWLQDWDFVGPFWPAIRHRTRHEAEKEFLEPKNPGLELTRYFVVRKDGKKIGAISNFYCSQIYNWMEIGYAMSPGERGRGYTTEAAQILVDFLFLSRQLARIQATVDVENKASQRVIEKAGFAREGLLRNAFWSTKGMWRNVYIYSITRDEWKSPRVFGTR